MQRFLSYATPIALATMLTGCFEGSSDFDPNSSEFRAGAPTDFTQFVKTEIENTDDTREPVNINDKEFSFNDQNNEQAFDELFIQ